MIILSVLLGLFGIVVIPPLLFAFRERWSKTFVLYDGAWNCTIKMDVRTGQSWVQT